MFPVAIEEYSRPLSIAEALRASAGYGAGEAVYLAGGQSVMQAIKARLVRPRCIVDLQSVAELKGVRREGGLTIGAMTRYVDIADDAGLTGGYAALGDAARRVGDRQVRNRGTIGGSLCWNYVASCMPAVVLGLGGALNLAARGGGTRKVAADDFLLGPLETARADDELLVSIALPAFDRNAGSAYKKWGLVTDALPVVGVCVLVQFDSGGRCQSARVALSGLAAGAQRSPAAEQALAGTTGADDALQAAFAAAADAAEAQADKWADAGYRKQLIRSLGREVAATAFERARAARGAH